MPAPASLSVNAFVHAVLEGDACEVGVAQSESVPDVQGGRWCTGGAWAGHHCGTGCWRWGRPRQASAVADGVGS